MNNQAMANKGWFLHIGGQPQGPFSVEQVAAKFREGAINRDSHVWCEGMPSWVTAKEVPELGAVFTPPPPTLAGPPQLETPSRGSVSKQTGTTTSELSHLIELNPHEVDDTTSAIDPAKLKAAKKEANAALKVADKAERQAVLTNSVVGVSSVGAHPPRSLKILVISVPLLAFAGMGGAVALKLVSVDELKSSANHFVSGLTSSFPTIEDVSVEDRDTLRAAADADLKSAGPIAAIALSTQSLDKPVFYVSSNLPDRTNLSFQLKSDPKTALTDKPIVVRFPLTLSKHLAKSPVLHTPDGTGFPQGEYTVTVVPSDDDQSPEVKEILSKSKLFVSQKFFLGGAKDPNFKSKLDQLHQKQKDKSLVEYKQALLLSNKLESWLTLSSDATQQLSKSAGKKPVQKKVWDDYDQKWTAGSNEPLEKGVFYSDVFASVHEIWAQGKKIHDLQGTAVQAGGDQSAEWAQVTALATDTQQKLSALKARLDAVAREVGASNADPAPGH